MVQQAVKDAWGRWDSRMSVTPASAQFHPAVWVAREEALWQRGLNTK